MSGGTSPSAVSGRLTISAERCGATAVVTLEGELAPENAGAAHRAVLEQLADGPRIVVLDLSRLAVACAPSVSLFAALAECATTPGQELLVAAPSLSVVAALERLTPEWLRVFDSVVDALDAVDDLVPRRFRELVVPWPGAQWQARRLVDRACATWELEDVVDCARVVVSVLVGNAVRHAGTDIVVALTHTSRFLHISVRDGSPEAVVLPGPGHPDCATHRGLVLVHELSADWGVSRVPDGKIVWATLRLPGGRRRRR